MILNKLRYYQMGKPDRHLRDIRDMLGVSGAAVNQAELECWVAKLGVSAEWQRARESSES